MAERMFKDWLPAFMEYASVTEAPKRMHFWSGVGSIAGALRRKVWIDMERFIWTPSFYVIYVAPPGIVAKTTTADIGMDLLRAVPGIKFGPDNATWQSLAVSFAGCSESFFYNGEQMPMSPLTLVASEFGNLVNLQDRDMVNFLITLWDGRKRYEKQTKMSGNDVLECPWINMQACTTPHWIAENVPASMIGGGLSSRCIFVYADKKEKKVAYVDRAVGKGDKDLRAALIYDLEYIATNLVGPFTITEEARVWGTAWYDKFWDEAPMRMDDQMMEGYAARKQTHMHKLAMVLSVSRSDALEITAEDLQLADLMLREIEVDMPKVFSRIGRTDDSLNTERFIAFVAKKGKVKYEEAYRAFHAYFPDHRDFEGIMLGAIRSGQVQMVNQADGVYLTGGELAGGNEAPVIPT